MLLDLFDKLHSELDLTLGSEYNSVLEMNNGIYIILRQSFLPALSPQSRPNRGNRTLRDRDSVVGISGRPTRFYLHDYYLKIGL